MTSKKLGIEFKSGKQASCADTYLTKGITKQRTVDWCEENKLNKLIVLNYTKRGKQLRDIKKNRVKARITTKTIYTVTIFYTSIIYLLLYSNTL